MKQDVNSEIVKALKEWAESSHSYLSQSKPYSKGYKDGISVAKKIVLNIIQQPIKK